MCAARTMSSQNRDFPCLQSSSFLVLSSRISLPSYFLLYPFLALNKVKCFLKHHFMYPPQKNIKKLPCAPLNKVPIFSWRSIASFEVRPLLTKDSPMACRSRHSMMHWPPTLLPGNFEPHPYRLTDKRIAHRPNAPPTPNCPGPRLTSCHTRQPPPRPP
jgi:hypothetical protein